MKEQRTCVLGKWQGTFYTLRTGKYLFNDSHWGQRELHVIFNRQVEVGTTRCNLELWFSLVKNIKQDVVNFRLFHFFKCILF